MDESFQDYSWIQDFVATFHKKSASKCWIEEIIIAYLIYFLSVLRQLKPLKL